MLIKRWQKSLNQLSGNLTTNEYVPKDLEEALLKEDTTLASKIVFKKIDFPKLKDVADKIQGLNILAGLQKLHQKKCITLYRAVRFPTYQRVYDMLYEKGLAIANYEQERILALYQNKKYIAKRRKIQQDNNFWIQPQERVVRGLPMFALINDALQIHHAYRGKTDKVGIIAIHIPMKLLKKDRVRLISNPAIDKDYTDDERDFLIQDFKNKKNVYYFDYEAARARGIDLHEIYAQGLPWDLQSCNKRGISQEFFLLDVYRIDNNSRLKRLKMNTRLLMKHRSFLHGLYGDQNVFGRGPTRYLPAVCYQITKAL